MNNIEIENRMTAVMDFCSLIFHDLGRIAVHL